MSDVTKMTDAELAAAVEEMFNSPDFDRIKFEAARRLREYAAKLALGNQGPIHVQPVPQLLLRPSLLGPQPANHLTHRGHFFLFSPLTEIPRSHIVPHTPTSKPVTSWVLEARSHSGLAWLHVAGIMSP